MLSELCVWLSLLHGTLEKFVYSGYESRTKLALWMFSVALYEVEAGLFDCVPEGQGVPSFIQQKPRFWKLFCAFHKALNASGMHIPGITPKMKMERSLLQFACWEPQKCFSACWSAITWKLANFWPFWHWERICECHHSFLKTTKQLRSL